MSKPPRPGSTVQAGCPRNSISNGFPTGATTWLSDTFLLTNVNSIRCLSVHAICEGGGISQSAEEYSARSVDVAVEGDAVFAGDLFGSSQVRRYFSAPAAGLACIRFVDQQRLGAGLPRFPQQEPLETVVSKGIDSPLSSCRGPSPIAIQ